MQSLRLLARGREVKRLGILENRPSTMFWLPALVAQKGNRLAFQRIRFHYD
jgi:hypothetical protein